MGPRSVVLALASALLGAGCFSPSLGDGTVACGAAGACPPGFRCGPDGRCWRSPPDAGPADAPPVDAAPVDAAPGWDAPVSWDAPAIDAAPADALPIDAATPDGSPPDARPGTPPITTGDLVGGGGPAIGTNLKLHLAIGQGHVGRSIGGVLNIEWGVLPPASSP